MNYEKAERRGTFCCNWMEAFHYFSFGSYYNPRRTGIGRLKVASEYIIKQKEQLNVNNHKNYIILNLVFAGQIRINSELQDKADILTDSCFLINCGSGFDHQLQNCSENESANFLQIMIDTTGTNLEKEKSQQILSFLEFKKNVNQWFCIYGNQHQQLQKQSEENQQQLQDQNTLNFEVNIASIEKDKQLVYKKQNKNYGLFIICWQGELQVAEIQQQEELSNQIILKQRDSLSYINKQDLNLLSKTNSIVILIEVPIQ